MTREEAKSYIGELKMYANSQGWDEEYQIACDVAINALEQEPTTKNDLGVDCISRVDAIKAMQDKAKELKNEDTINGLCGAVAILFDMPSVTPQESTTKNDLGVDCVARQDVERFIEGFINEYTPEEELEFINLELNGLKHLPSVTPQEPNTGHCKDCKWWKDSDGEYRRGVNAESQCPINRKEVYEGNGYCFLYEPQESEVEE